LVQASKLDWAALWRLRPGVCHTWLMVLLNNFKYTAGEINSARHNNTSS
jgi:hypothetical protein